jgi:hypothetical protein
MAAYGKVQKLRKIWELQAGEGKENNVGFENTCYHGIGSGLVLA